MYFNIKRITLLITLLSVLLALASCNNRSSANPKTPEDIIADSLQAVADSIAFTRQMHSMQIGYHQHSTATMASIQHQPGQSKKKIRFKKRQSASPQTENDTEN